MTAASATIAGRRAALARMVDACTITAAGTQTYDAATDTWTSGAATTVYTGACRVSIADTNDREGVAGVDPVSERDYVVSVPMTVTGAAVDQTVTITASALDPALVGLTLRVIGVARGTNLTARRLNCEVQS